MVWQGTNVQCTCVMSAHVFLQVDKMASWKHGSRKTNKWQVMKICLINGGRNTNRSTTPSLGFVASSIGTSAILALCRVQEVHVQGKNLAYEDFHEGLDHPCSMNRTLVTWSIMQLWCAQIAMTWRLAYSAKVSGESVVLSGMSMLDKETMGRTRNKFDV